MLHTTRTERRYLTGRVRTRASLALAVAVLFATATIGGCLAASRHTASPPETVLAPEMDYEGVDLPLARSRRGAAHGRVRQLRDPCIFEEHGRTYLLYSVAGESGVAIAELDAG